MFESINPPHWRHDIVDSLDFAIAMFCMKDFPIEASPLSPPVEGGVIDLKVMPTGVGHDRMISS